jgi:2,4-dienoyl-CoA reductase-like NADH-dependent reductase (Old Yellow Enzyme family)
MPDPFTQPLLVLQGEAGDLIACGRGYIANPDLVERIRLSAPLNEPRPEGYYGSSHVGYTDYPSLTKEQIESSTPAVKEGAYV